MYMQNITHCKMGVLPTGAARVQSWTGRSGHYLPWTARAASGSASIREGQGRVAWWMRQHSRIYQTASGLVQDASELNVDTIKTLHAITSPQ